MVGDVASDESSTLVGAIQGTALSLTQTYGDGAKTYWTATLDQEGKRLLHGSWSGAASGTFSAVNLSFVRPKEPARAETVTVGATAEKGLHFVAPTEPRDSTLTERLLLAASAIVPWLAAEPLLVQLRYARTFFVPGSPHVIS